MTARDKAHAAKVTAILNRAGFWSYGRLVIADLANLTLSQATVALRALVKEGKVREVRQATGVINYRNTSSYVS